MNLETNPELELALQYLQETATNVFLTGKAGTGKTTFLRKIKSSGLKRMVVVAPTGVAAINAGGMTIHSLFQLPLGLYVPDAQRREEPRKFSAQKLKIIRSLDLLVIDEISMVRADLLDAIDDALRRLRDSDRPFGNVQLLMIGDLHQLPPVVKPEDWSTLARYYETPYFFGSLALRKTQYVSIELKNIYRQSDPTFIDLLNQVRDNCLNETSFRTLNSRYVPNFKPPVTDAYITLTATNAAALEINTRSLADLQGQSQIFAATIIGDFPESSYPTEARLEFKVGAQVMFIKNDLQPERQYFNGKIGCITAITDDAILVRCLGDTSDICVAQSEWQNIKYTLNDEKKEIEEQVLGTFTQYPLKLAWAITIHKSQGLTFERAIIDAQAAFAHGQVYVALSRCKTFEGIVLRSEIDYSSVKTDPVVRQYSLKASQNKPSPSELFQARRAYQQQLIEELFSFQSIDKSIKRLCHTFQQHKNTLGEDSANRVSDLAKQIYETLTIIVERFRPQLLNYFNAESLPESNLGLRARLIKASGYFGQQLSALIELVSQISTMSDNQAVRKTVGSLIDKLHLELFVKRASFATCNQGFSTSAYKRTQFDAELDFVNKFPKRACVDEVPPNVPHPKLYAQLLEYRQQMADKEGVSPRAVLTTDSLSELVTVLPTSQDAIRKIHGIARKRLQRYGKDIETLIVGYCKANNIEAPQSVISRDARPTTTSATQQISLTMLRAGKTVEEIAKERGLSPTTIEGHLAHFVQLDQLDVLSVLVPGKVEEIESFFEANPAAGLAQAKAHFGFKFSYGELKLVLSHRSSLAASTRVSQPLVATPASKQ